MLNGIHRRQQFQKQTGAQRSSQRYVCDGHSGADGKLGWIRIQPAPPTDSMPSTLRILMAKNGLIISELNADLRTFFGGVEGRRA